jgi:hypothetical protein
MANEILDRDHLNDPWVNAYRSPRTAAGLLQFVWALTLRLKETRTLKRDLLVASPGGLRVTRGLTAVDRGEIAVAITDDIGVADILLSIPMPLDSEALEFTHFLALHHAENGSGIPSDLRADVEKALRDFLAIASRDSKPSRTSTH